MPNPNLIEAGKATRFVKGQPPGPGRPRVPSVTEQVRARLAEKAEEIAAAYMKALEHEDPKLALAAADAILDRLDGRPTQRTETTGELSLTQLIGPQAEDVVG